MWLLEEVKVMGKNNLLLGVSDKSKNTINLKKKSDLCVVYFDSTNIGIYSTVIKSLTEKQNDNKTTEEN